MTNPSRSIGLDVPLGPTEHAGRSPLATVRPQLRRIGHRRLLIVLDLATAVVVAATFAQLAAPELLFHAAFVILTAEAFLYGRRICLQRVGLLSVALLAYAAMPSVGVPLAPLELTEWPLMFAIAVLVAWMADREQSLGRRYAGLYRETRDRLVRAQEEERGRTAGELHDGIGQTLTALTLTLDAAATATDPGDAERDLDRARELVREAIRDTRQIAERVRPPRLAERGLASALRAMALLPGVPIEVTVGPGADVHIQPPDAELEAYRVVQEAVRNAIHHAHARRISVAMQRTAADLRLEVADDGVGFVPTAGHPGRLGIIGMRERAEAIGGSLDIASAPGRGTRITLTLPTTTAPVGGLAS